MYMVKFLRMQNRRPGAIQGGTIKSVWVPQTFECRSAKKSHRTKIIGAAMDMVVDGSCDVNVAMLVAIVILSVRGDGGGIGLSRVV